MGDADVHIATVTADPTPTLTTTRPERKQLGMGHVVSDRDVSTHRHAAHLELMDGDLVNLELLELG